MSLPYHVYGVDNSCYTHKVLGGIRSLKLPHAFLYKSLAVRQQLEEASGYTKMPVVQTPDGQWLTDSTYILIALGQAEPGAAEPDHALLPGDPVLLMLARILDDWIDEWLVRPGVYWRASVARDRAIVTEIAARNLMGLHKDQPLIDEQEAKMRGLADRLGGFFARVGVTNRAEPAHEAEVLDLMNRAFDLISTLLARQPFLLGGRVSLPDFALYGMLQGHLLLDPTPAELIAERWPGLVAYVDRVGAAEAGAGDWCDPAALPAALKGLLRVIADDFHGFLRANRAALATGAAEASWDGMTMTARQYTERCRAEIADLLGLMPEADRARVRTMLGPLRVLDIYDA